MGTINSNNDLSQSNVVGFEFRQVTGENLLLRPTAGEKFKMAFAKIGSVLMGVAGKVLSFFPGFGTAGSALAYGLQSLSQGAVQRMQEKRMNEANTYAMSTSFNPGSVVTPGFGSLPGSGGDGSAQVAPFAQGHEKSILNTLNLKGSAMTEAIQKM